MWFTELDQLSSVRIARSLQQNYKVVDVNLHTFVDASQNETAIYIRVLYEDQMLPVSLVAAKTKVAPIQSVSILRLELTGACLGSKLTQSVLQVLSIPVQDVVFWSDSVNVLWWIQGHSRTFKPFVANRPTWPTEGKYNPVLIQVSGNMNPADFLRVSKVIERKCWWQRPQYLHDTEEMWPQNKIPPISDQAVKELKGK